jgi:hypothetical protein
MKHSFTLFLALLALILSLIDLSSPPAQIIISSLAVCIGCCGAVAVFVRFRRSASKVLSGIEMLLFMASMSLGVRTVIDVYLNIFRGRK